MFVDSLYDASEIYDYVLENTHVIPIIDASERRGIVTEKLPDNSRIDINLRRKYPSLYSLKFGIERMFTILEISYKLSIWDVRNRSYNTAVGLKIIVYNLIIMSNMKLGENIR
ncbi:TVG0209075 [Thermoplasma volcanium GSS1]|uniref:TVG0209075 protein n=1 Tax=Thermoplasma volcanium (strain ATCC 51530 / DSM 4299 / JCM 9571 / NBRC 15438 / GSS1) TaxID=273116 RepID=Q97CA0_THEVO|nr:TVG0209075 [Thermoplasma volcanium GSS1]